MKFSKNILLCLALLTILGQTNAQDIEAVQPTLMVVPTNALLNQLDALDSVEVNGQIIYRQNYAEAYRKSPEMVYAIAGVEKRFAEWGFPLENLEQNLATTSDINSQNLVTGQQQSTLDAVLRGPRPDIKLMLTYNLSGSVIARKLAYTLSAVDAYTNRTVAVAQTPGVEIASDNLEEMMSESLEVTAEAFRDRLMRYFSDLRQRGRIITLRLTLKDMAGINFKDGCGSMPLDREIRKWLKMNAVKYAIKPGIPNTATTLTYETIRIPLFDPDGLPMLADEWLYGLIDKIGECGYTAENYTQGLGGGWIIVSD